MREGLRYEKVKRCKLIPLTNSDFLYTGLHILFIDLSIQYFIIILALKYFRDILFVLNLCYSSIYLTSILNANRTFINVFCYDLPLFNTLNIEIRTFMSITCKNSMTH